MIAIKRGETYETIAMDYKEMAKDYPPPAILCRESGIIQISRSKGDPMIGAMSQHEFIENAPRYDFGIYIIDSVTKQETKIERSTNELDEIIYEFDDMIADIDPDKI